MAQPSSEAAAASVQPSSLAVAEEVQPSYAAAVQPSSAAVAAPSESSGFRQRTKKAVTEVVSRQSSMSDISVG